MRTSSGVRALPVACLVFALAACGPDEGLPPAERAAYLTALKENAQPLGADPAALDALVAHLGAARVVLIGEATHGTQDFYTWRAELTRRLVSERGFGAVLVEAPWPAARRADAWVRGRTPEADDPLADFAYPRWTQRNVPVRDFLGWLRARNASAGAGAQAGYYGLDFGDPRQQADRVVAYLDTVDPPAAASARETYACVDRPDAGCAARANDVRKALEAKEADYTRDGGEPAREAFLDARVNALGVSAAQTFQVNNQVSGVQGWNARDTYLASATAAVLDFLGAEGRVVVWAHNSHVEDESATELGQVGQTSLGARLRSRYPGATRLVGLTTYRGRVLATRGAGKPPEVQTLREALDASQEWLLHEVGVPAFYVQLDALPPPAREALDRSVLQRSVGLEYDPGSERKRHYVHTRLAHQFDVLVHVDTTQALAPLD